MIINLLDTLAAFIGAIWHLATWHKHYSPETEAVLLGGIVVFLFCISYTVTFGG